MTVYQLKKLVEILDLKENSENTSLTPIRRDNYRKEYLMAKKLVMERIGERKYYSVMETLEGLIR